MKDAIASQLQLRVFFCGCPARLAHILPSGSSGSDMTKLFAVFSVLCIGTIMSATAHADDTRTIEMVIKDHKFTPAEITIPANTPVILQVKNADAAVEEFDSHDLRREKIIAPGMTAKIKLDGLRPGEYSFMGEFHARTAQGKVHVQ
jgi:plastocyanin